VNCLVAGFVMLGVVASAAADDKPFPDYKKAGPATVDTLKLDLKDEKRDRVVPIKVYFPRDAAKPCPVILFSHGLGGSRDGYEYLGQHWASHGYVAVHLQHLGSDEAVWKGSKQVLEDLKKAIANPVNAANRPLDVKFVLDQLTKLNESDKTLKGRLDLEHVGMAGHSFGAWTTLAIAGQTFFPTDDKEINTADSRIKAAIAMSPNAPKKEHLDRAYKNIKIPVFTMTGTKDTSPVDPNLKPEDRLAPFQNIKGVDQYLLVFKDGDHMVFSGRSKLLPGGERDEELQQYVRAVSLAFWDATLKGDATAKAYLNDGAFKKVLGEEGTFEYKAGKK
jgi:predicted dienelactone hydrolase